MAVVTQINGDYSLLADALQPLVLKGYFKNIKYDSESNKLICLDFGDQETLTLSPQSDKSYVVTITFRFDDGTILEKTRNIGNFSTVYMCSGGAYIASSGSSSGQAAFFISKTNRNKVGVAFTSVASGTSQSFTTRKSLYVWATDDDPISADVIRTFSPKNGVHNQLFCYCLPTSAPIEHSPSYFPDILVEVRSPYNYSTAPATNVLIDGKQYLYLPLGCYLIADEEAK